MIGKAPMRRQQGQVGRFIDIVQCFALRQLPAQSLDARDGLVGTPARCSRQCHQTQCDQTGAGRAGHNRRRHSGKSPHRASAAVAPPAAIAAGRFRRNRCRSVAAAGPMPMHVARHAPDADRDPPPCELVLTREGRLISCQQASSIAGDTHSSTGPISASQAAIKVLSSMRNARSAAPERRALESAGFWQSPAAALWQK